VGSLGWFCAGPLERLAYCWATKAVDTKFCTYETLLFIISTAVWTAIIEFVKLVWAVLKVAWTAVKFDWFTDKVCWAEAKDCCSVVNCCCKELNVVWEDWRLLFAVARACLCSVVAMVLENSDAGITSHPDPVYLCKETFAPPPFS